MTPAGPAAAPPSGGPHPELDALVATLERLRAPDGCAWDREQTHGSLVQYLVEETFELVEALEARPAEGELPEAARARIDAEQVEELGDVLYQVLFHADIAREEGRYTLEDVAAHMRAKMVGRHPHVFGDVTADTAEAVVANWEAIKAVEKAHRTSVLDGIPEGMPALQLADKTLGRAEKVGAVPDVSPAPATEEELGEALLALVASARAAGLDSERALRGAIRGLRERVRAAEAAPGG
ncbi:MAG: MazG family protein [Actinomycetales bacterium]|nr:MazG family protein [Actinomycetales bacterium]